MCYRLFLVALRQKKLPVLYYRSLPSLYHPFYSARPTPRKRDNAHTTCFYHQSFWLIYLLLLHSKPPFAQSVTQLTFFPTLNFIIQLMHNGYEKDLSKTAKQKMAVPLWNCHELRQGKTGLALWLTFGCT